MTYGIFISTCWIRIKIYSGFTKRVQAESADDCPTEFRIGSPDSNEARILMVDEASYSAHSVRTQTVRG